jgi:hypothetical protein
MDYFVSKLHYNDDDEEIDKTRTPSHWSTGSYSNLVSMSLNEFMLPQTHASVSSLLAVLMISLYL